MTQQSEKKSSGAKGGKSASSNHPKTSRELILVASSEVALRAGTSGIASAVGANVDLLASVLDAVGANMHPLFGDSEVRMQAILASLSASADTPDLPDLSVYYHVDAPDEHLDALAEKLRSLDAVHTAYVKPGAEPASLMSDVLPRAEEPPAGTPDFTGRQGYLDAAPGGIDAHYAWTKPGGGGAGVGIIDIEGEWQFTHEDLRRNQGGVVGGTVANDLGWRNHGTAVVGEFGGDRNGFGITGICPDANVRAISIFGTNWGSAPAIRRAADMLNPGDIILIELHRPGPRFNFQGRNDQRGYIAVEWWPDDFDAIRYAVGRGVVVVEAGGNGAENLDDAIYDHAAPGFPSGWSNAFRRGGRDSGAILVGAGAPPPGTHGRSYGNDRSRLDFSNYGSAIDAQGWGREVTTTGYGDLQGGASEDFWYTDQFSGTSSAWPIILGTLGCVQGFLRASGKTPLTPAAARNLLRSTGSPQQDGPNGPATQRIGNRPNLRQMIDSLPSTPSTRVALYRYWNPGASDHFYTTNWNELGSGRYGWNFEGVQCYVYQTQAPGSVPLHRYWNPSIGDHFYTTNWAELGSGRYGWSYEGIQCYVFPTQATGRVPLYRYWNAGAGDHFYTTNWAELGSGRYGWNYEGIQCYVFPNVVGGSPQAPSASDAPASEETSAPADEAQSIPESFTTLPAADQAPPSFTTLQVSDSFNAATAASDPPRNSFETKAGSQVAGDAAGTIQVTVKLDR